MTIPAGYQIVVGPKLCAGAFYMDMPGEQRHEICELCHRHGIEPDTCACIEYAEIDLPLLTFTIYDQDELGHRFVHPGADTAATHQVDKALVGYLPLWWRVDAVMEVKS